MQHIADLLGAGAARGAGDFELERLDELAAALAQALNVSCHVREEALEAGAARDPGRRQYYSTAILESMQAGPNGVRCWG